MRRTPVLLDCFSGAGGAAKGYQRAGFRVIGCDVNPQPHYCGDEFYLMDAFEFITRFAHEADAIHASPPCQKYTGMRKITLSRFGHAPEHPDLIPATRQALRATGKPYVIENVQNAPLETQLILCGVALGLPHLARHRHFESNIFFVSPPRCAHRSAKFTIGVYGSRPDGRRVSYRQYRLSRVAKGLEEAREAMGIDWMDWDEIRLAIPPVYTEWIGAQLMRVLQAQEVSPGNAPK